MRTTLYKIVLLSTLVVASILGAKAQNVDSSFYNLRVIDKPLLLPKHKFEIDFIYKHGVLVKIYNHESASTNEGFEETINQDALQIKYGLSSRLNIDVKLMYYSSVTTPPIYQLAGLYPGAIIRSKTVLNKGWINPSINLTFSLFKPNKRFEALLAAGYAPSFFEYQPSKPEVGVEWENEYIMWANYTERYSPAAGSYQYNFGVDLKYRFNNSDKSRYALFFSTRYTITPKSINTYFWQPQLINDYTLQFNYAQVDYNYTHGDFITSETRLFYQAFNLVGISLGASTKYSFGGLEEYHYYTIAKPSSFLSSLNLSCYYQVTPRLNIYEELYLPIAGRNVNAHRFLQIGLIYHLN